MAIQIHWTSRCFYGALGGFCALTVKYVGQDHDVVAAALATGDQDAAITKLIGYAILGPILLLLGAILAGVNRMETAPAKLLAIGISAPAVITTYAGASAPDAAPPTPVVAVDTQTASVGAGLLSILVAPAHAQTDDRITLEHARRAPASTRSYGASRGLRSFFNIPEKAYWVVAGSFADRGEAAAFAEQVNAADPALQAFIGLPSERGGGYPVILGAAAPLDEASARLVKSGELEFVEREEPFLSPAR